MFKLTNARGETVDINTPSLRSYTPTGLGLQITNSYSPYETYFIPTKSVLSQGIMQVYMKFGDIESQSYQSFSDFAQFLAYQPYTLEYDFDDNTYYRDARLQSLTKTEIGGSTIDAFDRLNEIFTLEFINNWYNNKTAEYKSYDPDPNLGIYGKIYRPKYDPTINRNLLLGTRDWTDNTRWNQRNTVTTDTYRGLVIASSGGAWSSPTYSMRYAGILQVGKTYTFSTYVRNTSDTDTKLAPYYEGGIVTPIGTTTSLPAHTDWFRVSITFQCVKDPTTSTANLRWEGQSGLTNGFIQFAGYKLEEGSIATDWTPAPEDNPVIPFGYAYAPYYVYKESTTNAGEKMMPLVNDSKYFGVQQGSPCIVTITGATTNPHWTVLQDGVTVSTDGFTLTLADNQQLIVSSYPEDQYARVYNPDGSFADVSQLQNFTMTNFIQVPEGGSTVLVYVDKDTGVNLTFKEERLLV